MPTPQEPTEREVYLAQLSTSDEDPEDLLAGGADIDDLIASGVFEVETEGWGWQVSDEDVADVVSPGLEKSKTPEEAMARLVQQQKWLTENGFV